MPNSTVLDVVIVYNHHSATSASVVAKNVTSPFLTNDAYNKAYGYFLSSLKRSGLTAGFTTSSDIIGPGKFKSYWTYSQKSWTKHNLPCRSNQIFDKFSPTSKNGKELRKLMLSSKTVKAFTDSSLFDLFFDKLKTFKSLPSFSIPTVGIASSSHKTISSRLKLLESQIAVHLHPADFSHTIIVKDRHGAGGNHIYKFSSNYIESISKLVIANPKMSFIIQPFIHFDKGFKYLGEYASTDIRLIYFNGKVVTAYLRMAEAGDFRCNQHQGGTLAYLSPDTLPSNVLAKADKIASILNKKQTLFTLDFIVSNSGHSYLLEGNTGPGLTWDPTDQIDKQEEKKLIDLIVKEFRNRINRVKSRLPSPHNLPAKNPFLPLASETLFPVLIP